MKESKPPTGWNLVDFDQAPIYNDIIVNEEAWEDFGDTDSSDEDGSEVRSDPESESEDNMVDDFHHELMQSDLWHRSNMISLKMENKYLLRELELGDLRLQNQKDRTKDVVEAAKKKKLELKQLQLERRRRERQKLRLERGKLARIEASIGQFWRSCEGDEGEEEGGGGEGRMEEIFCDSFIQIMVGQNKTPR